MANFAHLIETIDLMINFWNKNKVKEVVEFYSEDALLYDDDDGQVISRKNEIEEYLSITFELAETRGHPQIELNREKLYIDENFIIDSGTYRWPNMHSGRYLYKWQFQDECWRVKAHYFTIELRSSIEIQNGNANENN